MGAHREGRDEQDFRLRKGDRQHAADVQEAWIDLFGVTYSLLLKKSMGTWKHPRQTSGGFYLCNLIIC